ncbi:MAG: hypothetical protein EOP48_10130 [Sphingobacteriales bacterium]|nr:MAG: hypothetical protein EOP48_10130 [Sphingobacteriales bacterium]
MKESRIVSRSAVLKGLDAVSSEVFTLLDEFADTCTNENSVRVKAAIGVFKNAHDAANKHVIPFDVAKSRFKQALMHLCNVIDTHNKCRINKRNLRVFVSKILNKVAIKTVTFKSPLRNNSGLFIPLLNKLKPTDDGKDSLTDSKATPYTYCLFTSLGIHIYATSKDRAFS